MTVILKILMNSLAFWREAAFLVTDALEQKLYSNREMKKLEQGRRSKKLRNFWYCQAIK